MLRAQQHHQEGSTRSPSTQPKEAISVPSRPKTSFSCWGINYFYLNYFYLGGQAETTRETPSQQVSQAGCLFLSTSLLPCHRQWSRGGREWKLQKGPWRITWEHESKEWQRLPSNHQKLGDWHGINSLTALRRYQLGWHLDLGLLALRLWNNESVVEDTQFVVPCYSRTTTLIRYLILKTMIFERWECKKSKQKWVFHISFKVVKRWLFKSNMYIVIPRTTAKNPIQRDTSQTLYVNEDGIVWNV